ncbi:cytochrome oxidase small assembly protein [Massilia sp. X63]
MVQEPRKAGAPRPNNLRTALILGGIALFFFASVFVKFTWLS